MPYILSSQDVRITQDSASIAARIGALAIDLLIIAGIYFAIVRIGLFEFFDELNLYYINYIMFMLPLLYPVVTETMMGGQTVGKRLLRLRVVTLEGGGPKLTAFIMRWMMLPFDLIFAMGIGQLCVFFTKRQQRLGDLVAGTWVVRTKTYDTDSANLLPYAKAEGYVPMYPRAKNLTAKQAALLQEVSDNYMEDGVIDAADDYKKRIEAIVGPDLHNNTRDYFIQVLHDYYYEF